ncbi:hypothetical protein PV325_006247 [Microctonus aethiopoides]|uniref:Uncharacterized protein n=1 Tax=Microctonus aethiopoides TaxID=144406 RepID=A0AA39FWV0_9HYME|nr:hypothetical protein PV325_006247 [Microctonus aethiopoides]KAK0082766.1 hypothetical protein PV326_007040 [Microctonus aethiopoides]KAK0176945.1 hypothetical protein PV328_001043 [Microctonus aethiopoides]
MSRLQRLERVRELTREYTEALRREGIVQDPELENITTKIFAETLQDTEPTLLRAPLAIQYEEMPLPRGARPMPVFAISPVYSHVIAGWKCRHCNVLPPSHAIPWVQEGTTSTQITTSQRSANDRLRLKVPSGDTTAHSHRECVYRRGTFCGCCGEPGMAHDECPRCYPEKYQLHGIIPTPSPATRRG